MRASGSSNLSYFSLLQYAHTSFVASLSSSSARFVCFFFVCVCWWFSAYIFNEFISTHIHGKRSPYISKTYRKCTWWNACDYLYLIIYIYDIQNKTEIISFSFTIPNVILKLWCLFLFSCHFGYKALISSKFQIGKTTIKFYVSSIELNNGFSRINFWLSIHLKCIEPAKLKFRFPAEKWREFLSSHLPCSTWNGLSIHSE